MNDFHPISLFAPAKINLLLAITGTRSDGFHTLVSLVAPISLGDTLSASPENSPLDTLTCAMPGVPTDTSNLVIRATQLFREHVPECPKIAWKLEKNVPHGAGLGGGSSDAAAALKILNQLCGNALDKKILHSLAAQLGSDVPLFLDGNPLVMRGRGEAIESISPDALSNLRKRRFLLFKPAFGVSTADAYRAMKQNAPRDYVSDAEAEKRLSTCLATPTENPLPLFNNMERAVFRKHPALPTLFSELETQHQVFPRMSGSGSACFAEILPKTDISALSATIRRAWGESAFVCPISLA